MAVITDLECDREFCTEYNDFTNANISSVELLCTIK